MKPHAISVETVVFGSVSLDLLQNPFYGSRAAAGGAGAYAALGAAAVGGNVGLVGMISAAVPDDVRKALRSSLSATELHHVPTSTLAFDIHYNSHWEARYVTDETSGENGLAFEMAPKHFQLARCFHVCPMHSLRDQLELVRALRRATSAELLSVTSFGSRMSKTSVGARELLESADVAFLNLAEALAITDTIDMEEALRVLAGVGRVVVITLGRKGAVVINGGKQSWIRAFDANVVDPTGAGEAFAGAFAVEYLHTGDLQRAGILGACVASFAVEGWGIAGLLTITADRIRTRLREEGLDKWL